MQIFSVLRRLRVVSLLTFFVLFAGLNASPAIASTRIAGSMDASGDTATPIKHVIVILGENHTFDNVFATYQPKSGETIDNLLSKGIVTTNGGLGADSNLAKQQQATNTGSYSLSPKKTGAYKTLPQPNTTYALNLPPNVPNSRFPANLPNGPYQITKYIPYVGPNSYIGDPLHRFYQMWQQQDKGKEDLYTWVHQTAGDDNGANPPAPIYQGGLEMGYYNMSTGDAPDFKFIADNYAMSDNYHQGVMGGTGANHIMLGTGDMAYYSDAQGNPAVPPAKEIENPNAKPGTNNNFTQDGYAGGSYSECADWSQPGVGPVQQYIHSLPYTPFRSGDCAPGAYYLLNNYLPGYTPDGHLNTSTPYVVPPQSFPTIADKLSAHNISWKYYGQGLNNQSNASAYFCGICDPFQYAKSIMTTSLKNNLQDYAQLQTDITNDTLPAVSFVKPDEIHDGHPASSSLSIFEQFSANIIKEVMQKPALFKQTAVIVTMDEGGGYYNSGYVQPVSFFGDGPRIPLLVVSPYTRSGHVDHTYNDHVSILKFIEKNWNLDTLSERSLDNLPNPVASDDNAYKPSNSPAIGDLMTLFDFDHLRLDTPALPG